MTVWSIKTVYIIYTMHKCLPFRVGYSVVKVPGSSPFYLLVADFFGKLAGVFCNFHVQNLYTRFFVPLLNGGDEKNSEFTHCSHKMQSPGSGIFPASCLCTYKGDACEENTKVFWPACYSVVKVPGKFVPLHLYGDGKLRVVEKSFVLFLCNLKNARDFGQKESPETFWDSGQNRYSCVFECQFSFKTMSFHIRYIFTFGVDTNLPLSTLYSSTSE